MASLDELEMVLLMRLSEFDQPQLVGKIEKLLPIEVSEWHLNVILRHLAQCQFVEIPSAHGEQFVELTFLGRTVAKTSMSQLSKMERGLISRSEANKNSSLPTSHPAVQITNTFAPTLTNNAASDDPDAQRLAESGARAGWLGAWGTWLGLVLAGAALYLAYLQFVKE
jgi:hypothetical protein